MSTFTGTGHSIEGAVEVLSVWKQLAVNSLWNILGSAAPMFAAAMAIPILLAHLGPERFGLLTLVWTLIGYFSFLDFGVGRAITKLVAERHSGSSLGNAVGGIWTGLFLMLALGGVGSATVLAVPVAAAMSVLNVRAELWPEVNRCMPAIALGLPLVTITSVLRGAAEGLQQFGWVNVVRSAMGVLTFAGPLLLLPWRTPSLTDAIYVLLIARALGLAAMTIWILRREPALRSVQLSLRTARELLAFGGWLTVSNIISPVMVYSDRFMVSAILSTNAVAYYATPHEMALRLLVIPIALSGTLFPAMSRWRTMNPDRIGVVYGAAVRALFLALFPVCFAASFFAKELLEIWMGPTFSEQSYRVLQFLALGVLLNALASVPATVIQSSGRPDVTAKFHILELIAYAAGAMFLIKHYGIIGAAAAWTIRVAVDGILLSLAASRLVPTGSLSAGAVLAHLVLLGCFAPLLCDLTGALSAACAILTLFAYLFSANAFILALRRRGREALVAQS